MPSVMPELLDKEEITMTVTVLFTTPDNEYSSMIVKAKNVKEAKKIVKTAEPTVDIFDAFVTNDWDFME